MGCRQGSGRPAPPGWDDRLPAVQRAWWGGQRDDRAPIGHAGFGLDRESPTRGAPTRSSRGTRYAWLRGSKSPGLGGVGRIPAWTGCSWKFRWSRRILTDLHPAESGYAGVESLLPPASPRSVTRWSTASRPPRPWRRDHNAFRSSDAPAPHWPGRARWALWVFLSTGGLNLTPVAPSTSSSCGGWTLGGGRRTT